MVPLTVVNDGWEARKPVTKMYPDKLGCQHKIQLRVTMVVTIPIRKNMANTFMYLTLSLGQLILSVCANHSSIK
jgi:hypothetical protein